MDENGCLSGVFGQFANIDFADAGASRQGQTKASHQTCPRPPQSVLSSPHHALVPALLHRHCCLSHPRRFCSLSFFLAFPTTTMGKSLRSKVKKTYRGLQRQVMEPAAASRTFQVASALYETAGLPLPDPAQTGAGSGSGGNRAAWKHGGFVPITCFVPTPPAVRLNRVHGPLAAAEVASAAERQTAPPRTDYVGEREEPVVTAKDLPLQRPVRGVFEGLGGAMPGVTAAVAAVATEAAEAKKDASTTAAAVDANGATVGGEAEVTMEGATVSERRKERRRAGRGVIKQGKARSAGMRRHPQNKVKRVHRIR